MQEQDDHFRITCFLSRTVNRTERNYSASERECLAIVHAFTILKPYLPGTNCIIMTDCRASTTMRQKANCNCPIMRWIPLLQQFTFGIKYAN